MKIVYLFIKKKNDFCNDIDSFKALLLSNNMIKFKGDHDVLINKKQMKYTLSQNNASMSGECIYTLTFIANHKEEERQASALIEANKAVLAIHQYVDGMFSLNVAYDGLSLYYGQLLYPRISELEVRLREVIYLFMIMNVGSEWFNSRSPERVKKTVESNVERNHTHLDPDNPLLDADFSTLSTFLFTKYPLNGDYKRLLQDVQGKKSLSRSEINEIVDKYQERSNWDRYFADHIQIEKFNDKLHRLSSYRNMVAHSKRITVDDYRKADVLLTEIEDTLVSCVDHINPIDLSEEERDAVEGIALSSFAPRLDEGVRQSVNDFLKAMSIFKSDEYREGMQEAVTTMLRNMTWVTELFTNHPTDHSTKESDEDTPEDDVQDTDDDDVSDQDDQN